MSKRRFERSRRCSSIRSAAPRSLSMPRNQYFASRVIAAAIAERLSEPDPPEFVIVNPKSGEGWFDEETMSPARAKILEMIGQADHRDRFRIYTPVTKEGVDIYVHAKILIVDDQLMRVARQTSTIARWVSTAIAT
jgi:phosphatidylserine/phosphatidylglycerophosphate/cardiolipin synthase-like enzyme